MLLRPGGKPRDRAWRLWGEGLIREPAGVVGMLDGLVKPGFALRRNLLLALATLVATAVFASAGAFAQVPPIGASAEMRDAAGRLVANAELREGRGEVLITMLFPNPPVLTGTHGLRIHEFGRCD